MQDWVYTNVRSWGDTMYVRGYRAGSRVHFYDAYQPTLYRETEDVWEKCQTIFGKSVEPVVFQSMGAAKATIDNRQMKLHGLENWSLAYIAENWPRQQHLSKSDVVIANIDIEVYSTTGFPHASKAEHEVTAITVQYGDKFAVFGTKPYTPKDPRVVYIQCANEVRLLHRFVTFWHKLDPDIVTGWNIKNFDIPYLVNRMKKKLDPKMVKKLSPWGWVVEKEVRQPMGRSYWTYELMGISVIDYIEAYRKFRLKMRESYRLDYIAHVELGMRKIDVSEYLSYADLYERNFELFMDYNIRDVELVMKLDEKLGYITLCMTLAYMAGCNYEDVFHQTRVWDALINRTLIQKGIVVPLREVGTKDNQYEGAFVKEPQTGLHEWVVSYDAASLYPNTAIALNLGPETLVDGIPTNYTREAMLKNDFPDQDEFCLSANAYQWSKKSRSLIGEILKGVLDLRKVHKKRMLDAEREIEKLKEAGASDDDPAIKALQTTVSFENTMQAVSKVCANSAYGTLGSQFFRLYDVRIAEAITTSGQLLIQYVMQEVNVFLNDHFGTSGVDYIIAGDTDSIYVRLGRLARGVDDPEKVVKEFADGPLADCIKAAVRRLEKRMNVIESRWEFKRENIARRGVWVAKKRYFLDVLYNEAGRLAEPEIKVTGLEVMRSTTPEWARNKIKEGLKIILRSDEKKMQDFIKRAREEFLGLPIEDFASPTGVSDLEKYQSHDGLLPYIDGTPIQIRASLLYNWFLKEKGLDTKYPSIGSGDKIRYVLLLEPNVLQENVIGFVDALPQEFKLHHKVDYEAMFYKVFMKPVTRILGVIGWQAEGRKTLESFFR